MADKKVVTEPEEVNEVVEKAKGFWDKYSKKIIAVSLIVIVVGGGWLAYKNLYVIPNEEKAADIIFPAEKLFAKMTQTGFNKDSINLVLNGDKSSANAGLLSIIKKYGGTSAGNRARYMAGVCYLYSKDFSNSVKYLKEFSTEATQVQTVAYLLLGDANAELKKNDEALDYYKKAAALNTKDEFMTPEALYKAAMFAEVSGKSNDAIELYKNIKDNYPKSAHLNDVEKALAKLGASN